MVVAIRDCYCYSIITRIFTNSKLIALLLLRLLLLLCVVGLWLLLDKKINAR